VTQNTPDLSFVPQHGHEAQATVALGAREHVNVVASAEQVGPGCGGPGHQQHAVEEPAKVLVGEDERRAQRGRCRLVGRRGVGGVEHVDVAVVLVARRTELSGRDGAGAVFSMRALSRWLAVAFTELGLGRHARGDAHELCAAPTRLGHQEPAS